jgi:hypothetical protein
VTGFAELQERFQRGIVDGDDAILAEIFDGPRAPRETIFGVYREAFVLRLAEALRSDFGQLLTRLGEDEFDAIARAYVAATPSRHPNLRWYGRGMPAFLAAAAPYAARPELAEIAALEVALADAFDAPDAPTLRAEDLAVVAPHRWQALSFEAHPSVARLDFRTNAAALWSAAKDGAAPPGVERLLQPERLVVWRGELTPMVRPMSAEEAMTWDEAARGLAFGPLCAMVATFDDPEGAAGRAAGYLAGWISADMISTFRIDG